MPVNTSNGAVTTLVEADAKDVKTPEFDAAKAKEKVRFHMERMADKSLASFMERKKDLELALAD